MIIQREIRKSVGIVFLFLYLVGLGQPLPRRPLLGAMLAPLTDQLRQQAVFPTGKGVYIISISQHGMAYAGGLLPGDIILSINGKPVHSPSELIENLRSVQSPTFTIVYWRKGSQLSSTTNLITVPSEKIDHVKVSYSEINMGNYSLRTITTVPVNKSKKHPVVFYLQGVSCTSIDFGIDTSNSQYKLIQQFAVAGYMTYRVEKSGVADSRGAPCSQIDFKTELEGYKQALLALRNHPSVDTNRIFLFGHSMGGVMALLVAEAAKVKGIIVYGSIVKPLGEYFLESRRLQTISQEMSPLESEQLMQAWSTCLPLYLYGNETGEELVSRFPTCGEVIGFIGFRTRSYWQQLASYNHLSAIQKFDGNVLSLWGDRDVIADRSDQEILSRLVNQFHKGKAVFREVPNSTHELFFANSHQTTFYNNRVYNNAAGKFALEWMEKVSKTPFTSYEDFSTQKIKKVFQEDGIASAYPRWLGESDTIVFQSNRTGKWQLYSIHKSGIKKKRITDDNYNNNFVDVSPDGKKIAFVSDREGNEEIYTINFDGSSLQRLTNHPGRDIHPYFSPDSRYILFNSTRGSPDASPNFDIYQMTINGDSLKRITQTLDEETCARFSPDMKTILYLKGDITLRNDEVFALDVASGLSTNLTNSSAAEGWPTWSADGKQVVYSSDHSGTFTLYKTNSDRTTPQPLTNPVFPIRDARASIHTKTGEIVFNREKDATIGIYLIEKE